jgi:hypothetical protein
MQREQNGEFNPLEVRYDHFHDVPFDIILYAPSFFKLINQYVL